jgi:hypothetical protein
MSNELEQFLSKKVGTLQVGNLIAPLSSSNPMLASSVNITSATGVTISASQLLSGNIIRSGQSASQTDELPSAADLLAQININTNTQASVGMNFQTNYINLGAEIISLSGGANATLGGLTSVTNGNLRALRAVLANTAGSYFIQ